MSPESVSNAQGDDSNEYNENVVDQATKYLYESELNASWQTAVVYPDSDDTLSQNGTTKVWTITSGSDHVETTYDRLGRVTATTDQRGVVHEVVFDSAGRLTDDCVTSLGSSGLVDDAVLRITTAYDDVGRVRSVTSYDDPDPGEGSVVNQVKYRYNSWGLLAEEWEEHDGAIDPEHPENTPSVQYDYADGSGGGVAKYVRLDTITYPAGREISYGYGTTGTIDDVMSRLATIADRTRKRVGSRCRESHGFGVVLGRPWQRKVDSRPNRLAVWCAHRSFPNGRPRTTLRRMASNSASVCGRSTHFDQFRGI